MSNLVKTLDDGQVQILTTYFTGQVQQSASNTVENWKVCNGAFTSELSATVRLEIISYLTSTNCTGYIRVYDITPGNIADRIISNSIIQNKTEAHTVLGPTFTLIAGHKYEIQMRCEGPDSNDAFNILNVTPQEV